MRWARRKFKLRGYRVLARWWRHTIAEQPDLFVHWAIGGAPRVYVDPTNQFVQENFYRLEGALIVMALFGASTGQSWWRVTKAEVARSHQLDNEIDNVVLTLAKTVPIPGVS